MSRLRGLRRQRPERLIVCASRSSELPGHAACRVQPNLAGLGPGFVRVSPECGQEQGGEVPAAG